MALFLQGCRLCLSLGVRLDSKASLRVSLPSLPADGADGVGCCIAKNPDEWFQSADDIIEAFRPIKTAVGY